MRFTFTPAAERALDSASTWSNRAGHEELDVKSLLVGLLSEPECRAALMLARHGVDIPALCQQWPTLTRVQPTPPCCGGESTASTAAPHEGASRRRFFSPEVEHSLQIVAERLDFLPRPLEFATEHLLLGLLSADHDVSAWLRQRGLDTNAVEAEIRSLHGYTVSTTPASLDHEEGEVADATAYARWTVRARKVMQLANQEAQRFNHGHIGVEHILLGLLKDGVGAAAYVLRNLGGNLSRLRHNVASITGYQSDSVTMGVLPLTPSAKKVVGRSTEEARNLKQECVNTAHVLLALLHDEDGAGSRALLGIGLDPENVGTELLKVISSSEAFDWQAEFSHRPCAPLTSFRSFARVAATDSTRVAAAKEKESAVLRILDAAANRAREGLRVIEDYVRFVLDDQHLTELCKQFRHDLTAVLSQISTDSRMAARETQEDVGTVLTTSAESRRDDIAEVVRANFARLQESLRSLEEFGKLARAEPAESFKQLRYRAYTLERAVQITRGSIERLADVRLYVLVDGQATTDEFERLVRSLVEAGVGAIQLRDKQLADRELLARARLLRAVTRQTKTLCIVNDRPDVAALAGADGVHVGQEEISVKDARQIVGPEALVGVSTHNIEQARQAVLDGANYIGVGPTFPSATKQFEQFPGLDLLRAVAAEIRLPAFAIGGITQENIPEVLSAGFSRIAVSHAVTSATDPAQAARDLLKRMTGVE
jgi:thiamine-phosphate pyrophosphorylase